MIANLQKRRAMGDESGFTLIELLIVIVILGVLAGIVVFAVGGITDRGETAACDSNQKTVEIATEAYFAKYKEYPANANALVSAKLLREAPAGATVNSTTGEVAVPC